MFVFFFFGGLSKSSSNVDIQYDDPLDQRRWNFTRFSCHAIRRKTFPPLYLFYSLPFEFKSVCLVVYFSNIGSSFMASLVKRGRSLSSDGEI